MKKKGLPKKVFVALNAVGGNGLWATERPEEQAMHGVELEVGEYTLTKMGKVASSITTLFASGPSKDRKAVLRAKRAWRTRRAKERSS